jgi:hypothetical protein
MRFGATRSVSRPAAALLLASFVALPQATPAEIQIPTVPRCIDVDAVMLSKVDSAVAVAGDSFSFKVTERVNSTKANPEIPAGTRGYGVVSFADHAHGSGTPGRLALEPRFLRLDDGTRVQVLADPQLAESFAQGTTGNVSGAFAFVPGLGLAVAGYNTLHHGREVVIGKGTSFTILIGDGLATAECFIPPPDAPNIR